MPVNRGSKDSISCDGPAFPGDGLIVWALVFADLGQVGATGEGEAERDYIPVATLPVTTRVTPVLRWAAMRAILIFH